jgi:hypothetical protein
MSYNRFILERILLTIERRGDRTSAENRIRAEKPSVALAVTKARVSKRGELEVERNRREGKMLGLTNKNLPARAPRTGWREYRKALLGRAKMNGWRV